MRVVRRYALFLLATATLLPGCKPPQGTDTKALVGADGGKGIALTIIPLAIVATDPGAVKAASLRPVSDALVFVLCQRNGDRSATDETQSLEIKAAYGHAVIAKSSGRIFATDQTSGLVTVHTACAKVNGTGYLSARRVFEHFSDSEIAMKRGVDLLVSESVFLALRGPYVRGKKPTATHNFLKFSEMVRKEMGLALGSSDQVAAMMSELDQQLNPCVSQNPNLHYRCLADSRAKSRFNYQIDEGKYPLAEVQRLVRDFYRSRKSAGLSLQGATDALPADPAAADLNAVPEQTPPVVDQNALMQTLQADAALHYAADTGLPNAQQERDRFLADNQAAILAPGGNFASQYGQYQQAVKSQQDILAAGGDRSPTALRGAYAPEQGVSEFWYAMGESANKGGLEFTGKDFGYTYEGQTSGMGVFRAHNSERKTDDGYIFYDPKSGKAEALNPAGYSREYDQKDGSTTLNNYFSRYDFRGNDNSDLSQTDKTVDVRDNIEVQAGSSLVNYQIKVGKDGVMAPAKPELMVFVPNQNEKNQWLSVASEISADGRRVMPTEAGMQALESCEAFQQCSAQRQAKIRDFTQQGMLNPGLLPQVKK